MNSQKFIKDLDTSKPGISQEKIEDYNRVLSCVWNSLDLSGKMTSSKKKKFEQLRGRLQQVYYEIGGESDLEESKNKKKEIEMEIIGLLS